MTTAPPRRKPVILLDVMNTLVVEPFFQVATDFFAMTPAELMAAKHSTSWIEFEQGRIREQEYLARFFEDGRSFEGEEFVRLLEQNYRWIDGVEQLLAELLAAGHEMHALSNYPIWYRHIENKLQLSQYVRWSFVSCLTGFRKPDRKAYLHAVSTLDVKPECCLFVDDREENVVAALAAGLDAVLMSDVHQLRRELEERSILA